MLCACMPRRKMPKCSLSLVFQKFCDGVQIVRVYASARPIESKCFRSFHRLETLNDCYLFEPYTKCSPLYTIALI